MSPTNNPQFAVIDASALIGLCAQEAGKVAQVQTALQTYIQNGTVVYAPHLIVMEALYILCQKEERGELTAQEHATAIASLQAIMLATVQPPPNGDASLIARAEILRASRGCAQSADSMYLALAEELATSGLTE